MTLNMDGTPRKKYVTKKMIMAKNRAKGQHKAWDTRRALYPETNGYKPEQVSGLISLLKDAPKEEPKKEEKVDVPEESESVPSIDEEEKIEVLPAHLVERLDDLDIFLNSIPGVEFSKKVFVREALMTAVDTILSSIAVVVTGEEEITKRLKAMMAFVEKA